MPFSILLRRTPSVLVTVLVAVLVTAPASATVWVASHSWPSRNLSLEARVDDGTDTVRLTITGPANVWLAYGFDATAMSGTYTAVALPGGTAAERTLGNHTAGTLLPPSITVESWTDLGNGIARFVLTRPRVPATGAWVFPAEATTVPIIFAVGQSATFGNHGSSNRSGGSITFSPDAVAVPGGIAAASWGSTKIKFRKVAE